MNGQWVAMICTAIVNQQGVTEFSDRIFSSCEVKLKHKMKGPQ